MWYGLDCLNVRCYFIRMGGSMKRSTCVVPRILPMGSSSMEIL